MSHPILFQPRWFSPLLSKAAMWRISPVRNTDGKPCLGGPRPLLFLTGDQRELVTVDVVQQCEAKVQALRAESRPRLADEGDATLLAQQQLSGFGLFAAKPEVKGQESTAQSRATEQVEGEKGEDIYEAEKGKNECTAETLISAIGRRIIDKPFDHFHGAVGHTVDGADTLEAAAARFLAFQDALNIQWTHVVAGGREGLLAAYLATHHPHRIGSLILVDTPILPASLTPASPVFSSDAQTAQDSPEATPLSRFLEVYPTMQQMKYMLHPILFLTAENSGKTEQSDIDSHKRHINVKKVVKLKGVDGDALAGHFRGKLLVRGGETALVEPICEALAKWAERFDLMTQVNRRWAAARSAFLQETAKQSAAQAE